MDLYGDFGHADLGRYLLVQISRCDKSDDLLLAIGEALVSLPEVGYRSFASASRPITIESDTDGIEQILIAKWLGQEFDRPCPHRPHGHGDIAVAGNEDDGNINIGPRERGLKIQTA